MLRKYLPHIAIILSAMYTVFFFIDRVNRSMAFINNNITKVLLLILAFVSVINAIILIAEGRIWERGKLKRAQERRNSDPAYIETKQTRARPAVYVMRNSGK